MSDTTSVTDPFTTSNPPDERLRFRVGMFGAFIPPIIFLVGALLHFVVLRAFDTTALTMSGVVGLLLAGLLATNIDKYWDAAVEGLSSKVAQSVVLILLVVGPLTALMDATGVSDGLIWLTTAVGLPTELFIAAVFLATCAMSISTGTSLGTIFTTFPIFYPAAAVLDTNPLLLAGAIFSGAMFGDNLAPISDTTIVSSSTQRYRTKEGSAEVPKVVMARARYALTTAAICLVLFTVLGYVLPSAEVSETIRAEDASPRGLLMVIAVTLLIATAFITRSLYLAITVGLITGTTIGLLAGMLQWSEVVGVTDGQPTGYIFTGIVGMLPLVGLTIAVFGMVGILKSAGVFDWLIAMLGRANWTATPRGSEIAIGIGQSIATTIFAGAVGPSIVTFGPVADEIGAKAKLHPIRRANVMEGFGMGLACIVPASSAFLFILSNLSSGYEGLPHLAPLELAGVALYPIVLTLVMIISVATGWGRTFEGPDGTPLRFPRKDEHDHAE